MRPGPAVPVARLVRLARRGLARLQRSPRTPRRFTAPPVLPPEVAARLRERTEQLTLAERRALDPTTHPRDFRQPNDTSCGATSLVVSRMLHDEAFALWLTTGLDVRSGATDTAPFAERWPAEVVRMHRRVSGLRDHDGNVQWPWLRVVGTSPWGAARQMTGDGGSGLPGHAYEARTLDPDDLGSAFDLVLEAVEAGHTVPLYVGDDVRPAHVVLAVSARDGAVRFFEPSAGRLVRVDREAFATATLQLGGWSVPWFAVLPR